MDLSNQTELQTHKQNHDLLNTAIDAMSKLLRRWAVKGKGLEGEDKNGVVVLFNKKQVGLLMFQFVTIDNLSVELEFDLNRLRLEEKEYMEFIVEVIVTQLNSAREKKQEDEAIIILPAKNNIEPAVSVKSAVHNALNNRVIH